MRQELKALAFAALLLGSTTTNAAIVYDFRGTCSFGCVGFATGVLTLPDSYVPGERLYGDDPIIYSFHFDPARLQGSEDTIDGTLPVKSGRGDIFIDFAGGGTYFWTSDEDDTWTFRLGEYAEEYDLLFYGDSQVWTLREEPSPVPIPATAWLLLSGLGGLGIVRRRRKTA